MIKKIFRSIFFLTPIINALSDVTVGYFSKEEISVGALRAVIVFTMVLYSLPRINFKFKPNIIIIFFLLYAFILVFYSSNIDYSFQSYLKFFLSLIMYPISFIYIKNKEDFLLLTKSIIVSCFIIIVQFIIANMFALGERAYRVGIYTGGSEVQVTYILAYFTIMVPFVITYFGKSLSKKTLIIISMLSLMFVIAAFRRSSIIAVLIGFTVLYFRGVYRRVILYSFLGITLLCGVVYTIYYNEIFELLESRLRLENEIGNSEGRYGELDIVLKPYYEGNLSAILFGRELFNSINLEEFRQSAVKIRPIHVDYYVIMFSMGLIGIGFYVAMFKTIISFFRSVIIYTRFKFKNEINATFFAILFSNFVFSSSNQIWVLSSLSLVFLLLGSFTSLCYNEIIFEHEIAIHDGLTDSKKNK